MTLLSRLLQYSKDTKKVRDENANLIQKIENAHHQAVANNENDVLALKKEKNELQKNVNNLEEDLNKMIQSLYQIKSYEFLKDVLDEFDLNNKCIDDESVDDNSIQDKKDNIVTLLKRIKSIDNELIPSLLLKQDELNLSFEKEIKDAKNIFLQKLSSIKDPLLNDYSENIKHLSFNYDQSSKPIKKISLPDYLTVGNYIIQPNSDLKDISEANPIKIPFDIDPKERGNIILKIDSNHLYDDNNRVEKIIAGLAMRYIESFPSGHIKIGIYSSSITSFGRLNALFTAFSKKKMTITQEACKTRDQFSRMLLTVSEKGDLINSKLLENDCFNIYELYEKDIQTEDFQLVIVHDVFKEMTLDNISHFHGCMTELQKCGIRFIVVDDFSDEVYKNKPSTFMNKLNQILECGEVFTIDSNEVRDSFGNLVELVSSDSATTQSIYNFANQYCDYSNENKAPYLSYEKIGFGSVSSDKNNYESVIIPVALCAPNVWNIEFDCVGHSPNANLIVGIPGTGKSTLIDSLIMNGSMKYSPDELFFELLDFKDGISSSVYTMDECKIPHIKVVSQNNKPEEADIILSNILAESERRNKEFVALREETGAAIRNIVEYNKLVSSGKFGRKNMPRLIIVIDECQYLFDDENLAKKCQDIVRKCRSQGIHLILATQTLSHKMWNTVKFVEGIYCFEIAKDDAEQLLDRKYVQLIGREIPKGSYMAFASNNSGRDCSKIKVAFDGGNTSQYSKQICHKWAEYPIDLVTIGDKSELKINLDKMQEMISMCGENEVPIGENYVDHSLVKIEYINRKPLFLVGTNEQVADSVFKCVLYGAYKRKIKAYIIDASQKQKILNFASFFNSSECLLGNENDYLNFLSQIMSIYNERIENLRANHEPIVFVINGLHLIMDFLNNKAFKESDDKTIPVEVPAATSVMDFIKQKQQATKTSSHSISINGKETLIPFLLSNAYKVNIFICVSTSSVSLINENGEQVFSYSHKNVIRNSDYKILYQNANSDIRSIMEDTFKEKMLDSLSASMCFMSSEQRSFCKFRYFDLEGFKK